MIKNDYPLEAEPVTEGEPEDDEGSINERDEEVIPVIVGNRPNKIVTEPRDYVRKTTNRNNKLNNAIFAPKMTL